MTRKFREILEAMAPARQKRIRKRAQELAAELAQEEPGQGDEPTRIGRGEGRRDGPDAPET